MLDSCFLQLVCARGHIQSKKKKLTRIGIRSLYENQLKEETRPENSTGTSTC